MASVCYSEIVGAVGTQIPVAEEVLELIA